jgi:EAL domain-containing protein (putative c-di-GMP-specific phosphodiesterase class I)
MRLEGELRRALVTGQLAVVYQPMFNLTEGRITGFEALARWEHPELGAISPATFVPIAEDTGLIVSLTDFVLRSACNQLRKWQLRDERFAELNMHVNLSGNDVVHAGLVARVNAALVEARLQPQHLTLELTENILMKQLEAALPTLAELRRLGVGLSVDDFGTGYTSLQHLSSLPVSSLKVDRAFVAGLKRGANNSAIVRAILVLGESLGKTIIAEGIETSGEMEELRKMGCVAGQGFHLSRPLAVPLVDRMLDGLVATATVLPGRISERMPLFH